MEWAVASIALTAGRSLAEASMPTACEPWPGKRKAVGESETRLVGPGSCWGEEVV